MFIKGAAFALKHDRHQQHHRQLKHLAQPDIAKLTQKCDQAYKDVRHNSIYECWYLYGWHVAS